MGGLHDLLRRTLIPGLLLLALPACGQGGDPGPAAADPSLPAPANPLSGGGAPVNPLAGGGPAPANPLAGVGATLSNPHCELAGLDGAESARVKEALGAAAGVRVSRVTAGGPLDAAGLRAGDVLVALGGAPVRSPAEALARLRPGAGDVELAWLRPDASGAWMIHQGTIRLPGAAGSPPSPPEAGVAPPAGPGPSPAAGVDPAPAAVDRSLAGCVGAYFRMLDLCRTEAWGRRSETPAAVVRYATGLLEESLGELSVEERAAVGQIPDGWALLQEKWQAATPEVREKQREYWRTQMVLPNPLLPHVGESAHYGSRAGHFAFDYPAGWMRAETEDDGVQYLFVGPPVEVGWDRVGHPATTPPGVLLAIAPIDEDLRAAKTPEAGARLIARQYVTAFVPALREVALLRAGPAAIVVLRGVRPGEAGESFCWLGCMPYGSGKFLAARVLGPVSRAEELLPAFSMVLATMDVRPPDDLAGLTVGLAASMIGNAVMAASWHD